MICETILNDSGYPKIYCTAGLLSSREPTKEGHLQLLHRAARWGESGSNLENYLSANRLAAAPTHEAGVFFGSAIVCLGVLRSVERRNTAIVKCSAIHHRVREKDCCGIKGVNCCLHALFGAQPYELVFGQGLPKIVYVRQQHAVLWAGRQ